MNYERLFNEAMETAKAAGFVGFSPAAVIYMQDKLLKQKHRVSIEDDRELAALRDHVDTLRKALQEIVAYGKELDGNSSAQHAARIAGMALAGTTGESPTA